MTIQTMQIALQNNLKQCNTAFERSMVIAIGGKEIRNAAILEYKTRGKLSPASLSIAKEHGFNLA